MSHLPDGYRPKQAAGLHDQHENEQDIGRDLFDTRIKEIPREIFQHTQQHATDDGPRDIAKATKDGPGKGFDANNTQVGIEVDNRRNEYPGNAADASTNGPGD